MISVGDVVQVDTRETLHVFTELKVHSLYLIIGYEHRISNDTFFITFLGEWLDNHGPTIRQYVFSHVPFDDPNAIVTVTGIKFRKVI